MQVDFIKREGISRGAGFILSINLLIRKLLIIFPTTIPIIGCIIDFRGGEGKIIALDFFLKSKLRASIENGIKPAIGRIGEAKV